MEDFIAGLVGGTFGLAVGHPLDTAKALIQTRNHKSLLSSTYILFKQNKHKDFFRGLALPFASYGPINSLLFGIYGNTLRYLEKDGQRKEANLKNVFIAGVVAGSIVNIPNTPLELIKIQLQTHDRTKITGVKDCMKQIYQTSGASGFFRGLMPLMYRDCFSYGLYFFAFEYFRRKGKENGIDNETFVNLICGGIAGSISWMSILPLDVVKSMRQANRFDNLSIIQTFQKIYRENGVKGYFKGGVPILIRGFLVSAVTFCVHHETLNLLTVQYN